jgi:leucine-rich repeat protein SHOC2
MISDVKLKIRHAKRGNERHLDLSNMGLSELPIELTQLTMLESLNVQNNKLQNLKRVEQLPNLREIDASNNLIMGLHKEMLDMFSIETIKLYGNPIVN